MIWLTLCTQELCPASPLTFNISVGLQKAMAQPAEGTVVQDLQLYLSRNPFRPDLAMDMYDGGQLVPYDDFHKHFQFAMHMPWSLNSYGLKVLVPQIYNDDGSVNKFYDNLALEGEKLKEAKSKADHKTFHETAQFAAEVQEAAKAKFRLCSSRAKRKAETMESERDQKITKTFQRMWVQVSNLYGRGPQQLGLAKIISEAEEACKA